jgi:hypothetical protein
MNCIIDNFYNIQIYNLQCGNERLLNIFTQKLNYILCSKSNGTGGHHVKKNKWDSERQILHVFSHKWNLDFLKNDTKIKRVLFGRDK